MAGDIVQVILRLNDQASAELKDVGNEARNTSTKLKGTTEASKGLSEGIDSAGRAGVKLRGILSTISPELGAMAGFVDDAADGLEGLSKGGATLNAVVAGLAIAAAAGGVAWAKWTAEVERAAEQAAFLSGVNDSLLPTINALRDAQIDLAVATGQMTEMQGKQAASANAARDAVLSFAEGQQKQREEIRKTISTAETWRDAMAGIPLLGEALQTSGDYWMGWSDTIRQGEANLSTLDKAVVTEAENQGKLREAVDKTTGAIKAQGAAAKLASFELGPATGWIGDEERIRKRLAEEKDKTRELERQQLTQGTSEMMQATVTLAESAKDWASTVASGAGMAAGGPSAVMGAVSSAGPWGSIIASLVSIAGDFKGLGDSFNDFTVNFNESMANLPETLEENLGRWIAEGTSSAIEMLFSNIDAMVDPDMWYGVGEAIVQGFIDSMTTGRFVDKSTGKVSGESVGMGLLDIVTGGLSGNIEEASAKGELGSFDTGVGYVNRTGLAVVHQGENIVAKGGAETGTTAANGRMSPTLSGSGGRVTLDINVDDLVRAINPSLGSTGRGLAWRG